MYRQQAAEAGYSARAQQNSNTSVYAPTYAGASHFITSSTAVEHARQRAPATASEAFRSPARSAAAVAIVEPFSFVYDIPPASGHTHNITFPLPTSRLQWQCSKILLFLFIITIIFPFMQRFHEDVQSLTYIRFRCTHSGMPSKRPNGKE